MIGLAANNGKYLWDHPVANFCKTNCTSAVWGDDNLLWAATKGVGGTRVIKLAQSNGKTSVKEVWMNRKIRLYHWNAVRVGEHVYASSGDARMFLSVINAKTGNVAKRIRGFGSTNLIHADGKLIMLDDSGKLALGKITPGGLDIVSQAQVLDSLTWTPPTLVGSTLFVRDRTKIIAFDLG